MGQTVVFRPALCAPAKGFRPNCPRGSKDLEQLIRDVPDFSALNRGLASLTSSSIRAQPLYFGLSEFDN